MPPRGHSGSSHRSSFSGSHSSFHSSSSHRSTSSSYGSSYSSYRSSYSAPRTGASKTRSLSYTTLSRPRTNQPTGFHSGISNYEKPKTYHGKAHDYVYYSTSWTDEENGTEFKKGYYDEYGRHYDSVVFRNAGTAEALFTCNYCGTETKIAWTTGQKPTCPNCGAQMAEVHVDDLVESPAPMFESHPDPKLAAKESFIDGVKGGAQNAAIIAMWIFYAIFWIGFVVFFAHIFGCGSIKPIYVQEIGRECKWLSEYESYYDAPTDCYFWYNDNIEYPDWQYWYEDISSHYGDYGWMEYDQEEHQWYIEITDSFWIELPPQYDTTRLWYIKEPPTAKK